MRLQCADYKHRASEVAEIVDCVENIADSSEEEE